MIAMKIGRTQIQFLREVFASLAVRGDLKVPEVRRKLT